jgi:hypothetical protein
LKFYWLFLAGCTTAIANPSIDDIGPFQDLLEVSLNEHFEFLGSQDESAYYLSYTVTHSETVRVTAVEGLLGENEVQQRRLLDVDLRVGSMELDNTHRQQGLWGVGKHFSARLPRQRFGGKQTRPMLTLRIRWPGFVGRIGFA